MSDQHDTQTIDGTAEEVSNELVVSPQHSPTLFRTDDPVEVVKRASEAADALKDVLKRQGLTTKIGDKDHVNVEGWQTLGAMLGVTPVCEWTRPIEGGWEARVEAKTLDGRVIGAAEAECLKAERRWKTAEDYAIRSMAQTRAMSKALASVLRFVVTLAGYSGTPAEEMVEPQEAKPEKPPADAKPATKTQVSQIGKAIGATGIGFNRLCLLFGSVGAEAPKVNRGPSLAKAAREMSKEQAAKLLVLLEREADSAS